MAGPIHVEILAPHESLGNVARQEATASLPNALTWKEMRR